MDGWRVTIIGWMVISSIVHQENSIIKTVMDNKERFIRFVQGFSTMVLFVLALLAGVGAMNYGVTTSFHLFTVAGALVDALAAIEAVNRWKSHYNNQ